MSNVSATRQGLSSSVIAMKRNGGRTGESKIYTHCLVEDGRSDRRLARSADIAPDDSYPTAASPPV